MKQQAYGLFDSDGGVLVVVWAYDWRRAFEKCRDYLGKTGRYFDARKYSVDRCREDAA